MEEVFCERIQCANIYTRMITGLRICACTGGFKCFRRNVLESVELNRIKSDDSSFQIEKKYICVEKGFPIGEIPIIFFDRHAGTSKLAKRVVREAVAMVWKLKLESLLRKLFWERGKRVRPLVVKS